MHSLSVPSGALAVLDLDNLPEEQVEALAAAGALVVAFDNPRTYRVRQTSDGLVLRARSAAGIARRTLAVAASTVVLGAATVAGTNALTVAAADPVVFHTTAGQRVTLQAHRVVAIEREVPRAEVVEAVLPRALRPPLAVPASFEREAPAKIASPPRPPRVEEDAPEAERAAKAPRPARVQEARASVKVSTPVATATARTPEPGPTSAPTAKPEPTLDAEVHLGLLRRVRVSVGL